MEHYFEQIAQCLQHELYLPALTCSLALPDICAALSAEDGKASGSSYRKWYENYACSVSTVLTANDVYQFRCSLLHQGSSQYDKTTEKRIFFVKPNSTTNIFFDNEINGMINIDVNIFCQKMLSAATCWYNEHKNDEIVKNNIEKNLIQCYPNGIPGIINAYVIC